MSVGQRLRHELNCPDTVLGRRYMVLMLATIVWSILFMFLAAEYPGFAPEGSTTLFVIEGFIFLVFSVDFVLRLISLDTRDGKAMLLLVADALAILPSAIVVFVHLGLMEAQHVEVLALLRLFRLLRVIKLLRVSNLLSHIFGVSVFSLVFGVMAAHLGIRVLFLTVGQSVGESIYAFLDRPTLLLAVTAVGSVFGIALAITFGIVKRKQIDVTELHRTSMDAVETFEQDFKTVFADAVSEEKREALFNNYRRDMHLFVNAHLSYEDFKQKTKDFLYEIREVVKGRASMDVPYHAVLVQRLSAFLTKTQINFNPVFYGWLKLLGNLYFVLVMVAAPGLTGLLVQMLVIFVFAGLAVIIEDMDHTVDSNATIFNAKILRV
jgi:voltage-gated potassium channel